MPKYYLQNRWKIEEKYLVYYGIRSLPFTTKNRIKVNNALLCSFKEESGILTISTANHSKLISNLLDQKILVPKEGYKRTPVSLEEATICKKCVANDFIIPGLEFNDDGLCPMCQGKEQNKKLKATLPIKMDFKRNDKSRFDVAIFYTGGKDSTYLLYYFANVLKLRVLALTWEIPFMSDNARKSIENAKRLMPNVEFVNRFIAPEQLNLLYKKLLFLQNNVCACPTLAYLLFFPTLATEKINYLILGNEPVQMTALYYNNMAPKIAYNFSKNPFLLSMINVGRVLTLKKPVKSGQFALTMMIRQLLFGQNILMKLSNYQNQLMTNICTAMDEIPNLKNSLKSIYRYSNRRAKMPSLVHFDLNSAFEDGVYDWKKTIDTITEKTGWVAPSIENKALHTSCCVEVAKDHSQFIRFYNMETKVIPFSAIEIALASSTGALSRQLALDELKNSLGFTLIQPDEHKLMHLCNGCRISLEDIN